MTPAIKVSVDTIRPTQMSVGQHEVDVKRQRLQKLSHHEQKAFLENSPFPAVLGPHRRPYIVDHHHLGRAAIDAGHTEVVVQIIADLSTLAGNGFWHEMASKNWVHPYDEQGKKQSFEDIPHHLTHLKDDPYRSLASLVRHAGGYTKTPTPFSEFAWADYFRHTIPEVREGLRMPEHVDRAVRLAHSADAVRLPGYLGHLSQR